MRLICKSVRAVIGMKGPLWRPHILWRTMGHMIHRLVTRRIKISRPRSAQSGGDSWLLQKRKGWCAADALLFSYPHLLSPSSYTFILSDLRRPQSKSPLLIPLPTSVLTLRDLLHPGSKDLSISLSYPTIFLSSFILAAQQEGLTVDTFTVKLHYNENAPVLSNPSIRQSGIEFAAVFVLSSLSASQGGICWSGNCCAFLSPYLIQQSHHLGGTASRFQSQSGPKLSWQGRKREGK